jgi:hyperosmotically inducible protein
MFLFNTMRTAMLVLVCILAMMVSGCGNSERVHESWVTPTTEGGGYDDNAISANVMSRLSTIPELNGLNLSVRVENGEVFLSGTANSQAQIDQAVMQAWLVEGVQRMNNQITLANAR